jgi:hypothetical protein
MQILPALLVAGAGAATAVAHHRAGEFQAIQYREQAQQETDANRDREIERRRRLVAALASQNAEAGAFGTAPGVGSRAAIALSDARRAQYESLADRAGTGRRSLMLRSSAKESRRQGNTLALASAIDTAGGVMEVLPGK